MIHLAAFALMSLIWGLTWLPMKGAAEAVPPIFLAACRFVLAAAVFAVAVRATGGTFRVDRPGRLVLASLLITTLCYAGVFWGVARSPTGLAAVVNMSVIPMSTIAIGALAGAERITGRRLAAIALGIVGLVFLFSTRWRGEDAGGAVAGLAAVAAGSVAYAWGSVLSRPLSAAMTPIALAFWETLIGGLLLLPVSVGIEGWDPGRFVTLVSDGRALFGLLFLVVAGSLAAFTIYLWLLRDWGAFRAGLYSFVSPAVAVAAGAALGEPFGAPEALGMAAMGGATALVLWPGRQAA